MYVKACHSSWKKRAEQHLQETILKGATWLAYIFAPSLHAGNFMCPTGFYHSSLVGQCHMLQHNWPLINLFHTPFWWTTKIAISKSTQMSISLNQTSATFETKKWHLFQKKRFAKVQICKKSFDFLLVSCLWQLPRKKSKIVETMRHLETGIHGPGYLYTFAWCIRIWIYYTTMQRYNKTHTMTSILPLKHWHSTFDIWMIGLFCRIYSECLATQYIEVFIYFRIKCS